MPHDVPALPAAGLPVERAWFRPDGFGSAELPPTVGSLSSDIGDLNVINHPLQPGAQLLDINYRFNSSVTTVGRVLVDEPVLLLPILLSGKTRYRHRCGVACDASPEKWCISLLNEPGTEFDHRVNEPCAAVSLLFTASRLRAMLRDERLPRQIQGFLDGRFDPVAAEVKMSATLRRIALQVRTNPYQGAMAAMYAEGKVYEILAEALTEYAGQGETAGRTLSRDRRCALAARDILMADLANPPRIEDLARQVGLSQRHLNAVFLDLFGASPLQCLTQWRLDQARVLLGRGDLSVKQVTHLMGYAHVSSFSHAFTRRFGVPPSGRRDGGSGSG